MMYKTPEGMFMDVPCNNPSCGLDYPVRFSYKKRTFNRFLDYSICPHCNVPRNPALHRKEVKHCSECHSSANKLKKGMCNACYLSKYKEEVQQRTHKQAFGFVPYSRRVKFDTV